jgi:hypothetical protein
VAVVDDPPYVVVADHEPTVFVNGRHGQVADEVGVIA